MIDEIQIEINLVFCILLISLFVHAYFKMNRKIITNRLFMWMMISTCIVLLLEVLSVLLNQPGMVRLILWNKLANIAGFILTPCIPYLAFLLCKAWIFRFQKTQINKKTLASAILDYLIILPLLLNGILALASYNGGPLFKITDYNFYVRGSLFFLLPVISFFYFIISLAFIFIHYKKYSSSEQIIFTLSFILAAFFTGIQLKYAFYLTTWNSVSFILVIAYVLILNDQIYRDSLTGLENRLAYEHYAQKLDFMRFNRIIMIYLDIDNFKSINDCYGHSEGDEALKVLANLIIESFAIKKKKIMRVGGDEFLIISEDKYEKVENCLERLKQKTTEYNSISGKQYKIAFSYGMARYLDSYRSINQLLDYVDQKMYENKQINKNTEEYKKVNGYA